MAEIEFSRFSFHVVANRVSGLYAKRYSFDIPLELFTQIDSDVTIQKNKISFPNLSEKSANNKINRILSRILHSLTNTITKKKVLCIDETSNIPLIGAIDFGVIDRNTNILELKPLTGCNLNCIYCSVNEGQNKKSLDFLIDDYYLACVTASLASTKTHPVECNINPNGEPLLYPFLEDLIFSLNEIPNVCTISINTNATLLTKEKIDALKQAGLSRLNISLNTLDKKMADTLCACSYPLQHVLDMISYAQEKGLAVLIAPLILPGYNDDIQRDIEPLISFANTLQSPYPTIGFQKFLNNKHGRNPVQEIPFQDFFSMLKPFEEKYNLVLTPQKEYNPFSIYEDTKLTKPLLKHQVVRAKIVSFGRSPSERLCVANDRVIKVKGLLQDSGFAKIRIVRDKHNIYMGVPA